jgi:hypothetical protein
MRIPAGIAMSNDLQHPLQIAGIKPGDQADCHPTGNHFDPTGLTTPGRARPDP